MTTPKFTLPKGKFAYATLPLELRALIDGAVEAVKDKPWIAVYNTVKDFHGMAMASLGQDTPTDSEIETLDGNLKLMVTALLERLGANVKRCSDPFQAVVFNSSARKDHRRLARRYFKRAGGGEAVSAQMEAWAKEHSDELESFDTGMAAHGSEFEGDGPKSLEATLDEWIEKACERFDADGEVHPLAVGLGEDGSGLMLTTRPFGSDAKKQAFREMSTNQFDERGLTRIVSVGEAWLGPVGPVQPSKSNERREVICVAVSEAGETMVAMIPIERDWRSGRGILGEPEKADNARIRGFAGM